jgi:hypothetical protein
VLTEFGTLPSCVGSVGRVFAGRLARVSGSKICL